MEEKPITTCTCISQAILPENTFQLYELDEPHPDALPGQAVSQTLQVSYVGSGEMPSLESQNPSLPLSTRHPDSRVLGQFFSHVIAPLAGDAYTHYLLRIQEPMLFVRFKDQESTLKIYGLFKTYGFKNDGFPFTVTIAEEGAWKPREQPPLQEMTTCTCISQVTLPPSDFFQIYQRDEPLPDVVPGDAVNSTLEFGHENVLMLSVFYRDVTKPAAGDNAIISMTYATEPPTFYLKFVDEETTLRFYRLFKHYGFKYNGRPVTIKISKNAVARL